MGADLSLEFVAIDKEKSPDWAAGLRHLETLKNTHVSKWPEEYREYELFDGPKEESEPDMNERTAHVEKLSKLLDKFKEAWDDGYRDTCQLEICHKMILISGGMSWGDPPTESCEMIADLVRAGVTQAMGFDW